MPRLNTARIGWLLCRVVVPLWVASGAIVKLMELSPKTLPKETILTLAHKADIDLYVLLAVLISLEFVAVFTMLLVARLARPMAVLVLGTFCVLLIGELVRGNITSCGCFGEVTIPPWLMLLIDGPLLIGVLVFDPTPAMPAAPRGWPKAAAVLLAAVAVSATFWRILPERQAPEVDPPNPVAGTWTPKPLPAYWFVTDIDAWIGKPWREIELFQFLKEEPQHLDEGRRYVVFYGRTCDHCDDMFHAVLIDPAIGSLTTAIEVPFDKTHLRGSGSWPMPETECEHLQLPVGCDWIITTPLVVTLQDGIVECAEEGDHTRCLGQ
jgi:hypothetical protein